MNKNGKNMTILEKENKKYKKRIISLENKFDELKKTSDSLLQNSINYRRISEVSPSIITVYDCKKRKNVFQSRSLLQKFGFTKNDIKKFKSGKFPNKSSLVHPDDMKLLSQSLKDIRNMKNGRDYIVEYRLKDKKGNWQWIRKLSNVYKRDRDGKPVQIISSHDIITDHKISEQKLIETKQLLEKITSTSPEIIAVADLKKGINIYQNRSILELLGYSKDRIKEITRNQRYIYKHLLHQDDLKNIFNFDKKINTFKDNTNYEIEYRLKSNNGVWHWVRRVCRVFQRDNKGFPSHIVSIFESINENKKAEEALVENERTAQALLNTIPETVFMQDLKGHILALNDTAAKRFGYSKEKLIGKCVYDLFPEKVAKARKEKLKELIKTKEPTEFRDERNGRFYDTIGYPLFDTDKNISKVIVFAKDITQQLLAARAIKESEERYRDLTESSPEAIIVHFGGKILFANKAASTLLGYDKPDEMLGKNIMSFLHPDYRATVIERINKITVLNKEVPIAEEKFIKKDGEYIDVEVTSLPFSYRGNTAVQVIARDISFRKEAEKALKQSEERYRAFITQSTEGIYRMELERPVKITVSSKQQVKHLYKYCYIAECNDVMAAMYSCKKASELSGIKLINLHGGSENPHNINRLTEFINSSYRILNKESQEQDKDGKIKYFVNNAVGIVEDGYLTRIWGTQTDVTELREKEAEIRKLSRAVEQSPVSIIITNTAGDIEYVNPKFTNVTGYSAREVKGKNPRILKSGEKSLLEYKELWDTIKSGNEWQGEFHNKKKNGKLFWESALITPIKNDKGDITHFLSIKQDITEQKYNDEQLKQSLKEKEVMLREIHHRVKNNLQIISSLLKLQGGYTNDPVASEYLKISQQRVRTMALIHQQLYRSDDLSGIDFGEYLKKLIEHLFSVYGIDKSKIKLNINANRIFLSIEKAIPCGLIVNELVTNSIKHAFTQKNNSEIEAVLSQENNSYKMIIKDNGTGFPKDVDFRNTSSLGMQLVITLTEQLGGILELNNGTGTEFIITFPVDL